MSQLEPGSPAPVTVRGRLRLGDAGLERAVGVFRRAFEKGQPSQEEFNDRISPIYAARIRNDLRPFLEDLGEYQAVRIDPRRWCCWLDWSVRSTYMPPVTGRAAR